MMLQPTDEQIKLYEKLDKTESSEEKEKIFKRLKEIAIQRQEELKNCPFCH